MPTSVSMPALGESVTEGTVTQWLKKEGDTVAVDEPLLEVSTDKVDTEIPSPVAGVLSKILVAEDETVEIGAEIAIISGEGEDAGAGAEDTAEPAEAPAAEQSQEAAAAEEPQAQEPESDPAESAAPQQAATEPAPAPEPAAPAPSPRPSREDITPPVDVETLSGTGRASGTDAVTEAYVTPLVRKLAAQEGVDLSQVQGTGVGGRIRKQDVQEAARRRREAPAAPAAAQQQPARTPARRPVADTTLRGRTETMSRLRQTIADQMAESQKISAEVTQVIEVDVTNIARLRERAAEQFEAREGVELGFFPFFALATVEALKAHPKLNAVIDSAKYEVTYHSIENLGISVDTEPGLLVPVIKDAGDLNLGGLARKIADLTERAHTGDLNPDELSGGTFTLADTGEVGALFNTPVINQPQVGILSTGAVVKRPVVVEDPELGEVIAVRSMMYLALTHDHRLIDSADAARFLADVRERLEEGDFESELGLA
ncbi:2-oxoglutarate dehydrogenase, E2 component, dihydrolipoamide succinyltransferase [Streptomonospora nanhaiensis]|uniref:Dihydrolipoamide acetyltransferase component of pyruvate dehydrogenase complex n=1 Tax=Streptomonospora nanhaiensis TaxID=1323731 RepID=A0A853BHL7_9ACTN|nr:2-oxoglutarate dehydrogenase, E2 component, dihydrolipoamide succinyltransferase [Streptomonospora nanhaiensis]NYI94978.1 2-oxoglutarate dehydrogenase E2 component (dihydrolipoamide succinyltransferase) [Streptomonospora nanhaiensis]